VASVACREGHGGILSIEATPAPGQDVSLELYSANSRADLLAEALAGPVEVIAVAAAVPA
jgi:hypothetical protein